MKHLAAIALMLAAGQATAAFTMKVDEKPATPRQAARYLASVETAIEMDGQKGYCRATIGRPGVVAMMERMCREAAKGKQVKASECTQARARAQAKAELDRCNAMPVTEYEKDRKGVDEARAEFLRQAKANGIDGEKMLADERAKLARKK